MKITDRGRALSAPDRHADRGTYPEGCCHCCHDLCATCHPAVVLDAGRVEIAHEAGCGADHA